MPSGRVSADGLTTTFTPRRPVSPPRAQHWSEHSHATLLGALFLLYSIVRVSHFVSIDSIVRTPDTPRYVNSTPVLSWSFWTARRPLTVPLAYRLVGQDFDAIVVMQLIVSMLAWGLLALTVARVMRTPRLRPVAFVAILLLSLADEIIIWDRVVLTESIALSLMAALVASWLWFLSDTRWTRVALLLGTATLWIFARDVNAPIAVLVGFGVAIFGIASQRRSQFVIGAALLLLAVLAGFRIQATETWQTPLMNVVGERVLPFPERTAFFVTHGMPMSPALARRAGKAAWDDDWAFRKDPALADFREWLSTRGRAVYVAFLLAHPRFALRAPFGLPKVLLSPNLTWWQPAGYASVVSGRVADALYLRSRARIWMWAVWALVGAGVLVSARPGRPEWWLATCLVVLFPVHVLSVWHGDSREIDRHVVAAVVQLRLGVWMLVLLALDQAMSRDSRNVAGHRRDFRVG